MNRRNFIQQSALVAAGSSALPRSSMGPQQALREYYELRVYELRNRGKRSVMDGYWKDAIIPALNALGIRNVGVFTEMGQPEPPKLYVLLPYASLEQWTQVRQQLDQQPAYQRNSTTYFEQATPDSPNYLRYKSSLMLSFEGMPQMKVPNQGENLFELRTYESFDEDAARRKIVMFNEDELPIFDATGLKSVFFGETLIGGQLPQLTYLLAFTNMDERDQNWKAFIDHPDWKRVSQLPEYADTVSRIDRTFLVPTDYSQV
jgi:hypothetical protein